MGSDRHYPEEAPSQYARVDDFWGQDFTPGERRMANTCPRYRPAARHAQPVDTSTTHVGFRRVRHAPGP